MTYKLTQDPETIELSDSGKLIYFTPGTTSKYAIQYQEWLDEGNTPLPADT